MLAVVCTSRLNIRIAPTANGQILGQLTEGTVIKGDGPHNNWLQIQYKDTLGFVSATYLEPINDVTKLSATVNTSKLNVRAAPSSSAEHLATLNLSAPVNILAIMDDWLEIKFNNNTAYVAQDYVDLAYIESGYYAKVSANLLNIRSQPQPTASLFGQLEVGTKVWVEGTQQEWSQIRFNGNRAYAASRYLTPINKKEPDEAIIPSIPPQTTVQVPQVDLENTIARLSPDILLPVSGNSEERKISATWNRWGAILQNLSEEKQLDVGCALSVLCVESSGKGFEQKNNDRMIIRFENHKFWKYWGKNNPQQYRQHFKYRDGKVWLGHQWRRNMQDDWSTFHGQQVREWQVFEFARLLDEEAAMLSISMGAPQIMGFNYQAVGYQSVVEMFDAFSSNIKEQITGLFDFMSTKMLTSLQNLEFEEFAGMYNGMGQKKIYGEKIQTHYLAYKKLMFDLPNS